METASSVATRDAGEESTCPRRMQRDGLGELEGRRGEATEANGLNSHFCSHSRPRTHVACRIEKASEQASERAGWRKVHGNGD